MLVTAFVPALLCFSATPLTLLERDLAGKISPFLGSQKGSFYFGGQSGAQHTPLTSLWPVRENETLGFTHPFFRDSRARGEAIVCDEITGCGHSLNGWEFYRNTRVLYGNVTVGATTYANPAPTSLLWRPDKLTARYELEPGVVLTEVKFFTNDDVLLNVVTLSGDGGGAASKPVSLHFEGQSYVNSKAVKSGEQDPSFKGLPAGAEYSIKRNSTVDLDETFAASGCTECAALRISEKGTGYAKPIDCKFGKLPEGVDCLVKEGRMMYDGMSVFIAASRKLAASDVVLGRDADRRATYNFTVSVSPASPQLVLGWVMGDDADGARRRVAKYMTPRAAADALAARSASASDFLTNKVPQLAVRLAKSPDYAAARTSASAAISSAGFEYHADSSCTKGKYTMLRNQTEATCAAACAADAHCVEFKLRTVDPFWCTLANASQATAVKPQKGYGCGCKGKCPGPPPGPPSPVPPMNRTLDFEDSYYFGWAMYWMLLLDVGKAPYETFGHAQSAPNNFLGIHLHDSQYYLKVGAWTVPEEHTKYAHGNVLMWHNAFTSPMYSNKSSPYWQSRFGRTLMPDNMGAGWIASSTCDQVHQLVEGAWTIYSKAPNATFLARAYELFAGVLTPPNGNITAPHQQQKLNWAEAKALVALLNLAKMARALGKPADAAAWGALYARYAPLFSAKWGQCGQRFECNNGVNSYSSALVPAPYAKDEQVAAQSKAFLMNDVTGHYPPNASYGAILLATALNETDPSKKDPWVAHTTYTYEAIDGLFRHDVYDDAVALTTGHIRDMQRTYGFTIFPEAWSKLGGPWGDQWYNWGSCASINLVLDRLCGVEYSAVDRAPGASTDGVLTVRDALPSDWERADVAVPLAGGALVSVTLERVNATAKRVTVRGNPLGALALQPWVGAERKLVAATPSGWTAEPSGNRVDWLFVDAKARDASVIVVWE